MSNPTLLRRKDAALVVVDIQERLVPVINDSERVIKNSRILIEGAKILGIPVIVTEQYPKGLGHTVGDLSESIKDCKIIEKTSFSCCGSDAFLDTIEELEKEQIILCGIETHVCVLQTALDLSENGLQIHLPADAVGSRAEANREIALRRMSDEGIIITCVESALLEMVRVAEGDEFKAISKLIK